MTRIEDNIRQMRALGMSYDAIVQVLISPDRAYYLEYVLAVALKIVEEEKGNG